MCVGCLERETFCEIARLRNNSNGLSVGNAAGEPNSDLEGTHARPCDRMLAPKDEDAIPLQFLSCNSQCITAAVLWNPLGQLLQRRRPQSNQPRRIC